MRVTVRERGNGAAIRLSDALMQAARLELDTLGGVREEDRRVVIEPVRDAEVALADLLAGITDDNVHAEVDMACPQGSGPA
jgi:antitoxin MazE